MSQLPFKKKKLRPNNERNDFITAMIIIPIIIGLAAWPLLSGFEFDSEKFIQSTGIVRSVTPLSGKWQASNYYVEIVLPDFVISGNTIQAVSAGERVTVTYQLGKHGLVALRKVVPEKAATPTHTSLQREPAPHR